MFYLSGFCIFFFGVICVGSKLQASIVVTNVLLSHFLVPSTSLSLGSSEDSSTTHEQDSVAESCDATPVTQVLEYFPLARHLVCKFCFLFFYICATALTNFTD